MPLLRNLTADEQRAVLHKIRNSYRNRADPNSNLLLDEMLSMETERELAAVSEEENFNMKNRYRL